MKMTTVYGAYAPPRAMLGTLPTFYLILPQVPRTLEQGQLAGGGEGTALRLNIVNHGLVKELG